MHVHHTFIFALSGCTIFFTLSHKRHDFVKAVGHEMCVSIFSTTFVWNISHSEKNWASYDQNVYWSLCKVLVFLVRFKWKLNCLDRLSKILKYQISSKSILWKPSCSMWMDRRIDMSKIIDAFWNFVNAPEKSGAISLFLQYAFMVWTSITLPLFESGLFSVSTLFWSSQWVNSTLWSSESGRF